MTQMQRSAQRARKDGARNQMKAESGRRAIEYDPDWAICPDGGSNNKMDYQRHFPTCNGYKCLYSCDSAWRCYDGESKELGFNYEMTVRQEGVSEDDLTRAILEMEERMLMKLSEDIGIDDCICEAINNSVRNLRKKKEVRKDRSMLEANCDAPEGQKIVNLSNLRRDEIVQGGVCKSTTVKEGERCLKMIGRMEFVHLAEPESVRRQLDYYEDALSQLNLFLDEGMTDGAFLAEPTDEEPEPIITGMTFLPDVKISEGEAGIGGPGAGSDWMTQVQPDQGTDQEDAGTSSDDGAGDGAGGTSIQDDAGGGADGTTIQDGAGGGAGGTAIQDGTGGGASGTTIQDGAGQGIGDSPPGVAEGGAGKGKEDGDVLVIEVEGPTAASRGNRPLSYGMAGLFAALGVIGIFIIGMYLRRRKKNKDTDEVSVEEDNLSLSTPVPADDRKDDGSFPTVKALAFDLGTVTDDTVPATASEEAVKNTKSADMPKTNEAGDACKNEA